MISADWPFAGSTALSVKDTPASGRAAFADERLKSNAILLTTTAEQSPLAHVIFRPYRKEACAQCFAYDRGRDWKIRDAANGVAFCTERCQEAWRGGHDALMSEATSAVEAFAKSILKKQGIDHSKIPNVGIQHESGGDATQYIHAVWDNAETLAAGLRQAREASNVTKTHRAVLNKAKDLMPDTDILSYTLSGIFAAYRSQKSIGNPAEACPQVLLPSLFALAEDHSVFLHTPTVSSPLLDYTSSYLVLLAILPRAILPVITRDLVINLASRASHNAFSIRPEGDTDGEQSGEYIGWGVWPEASLFNHSCRPNVKKERRGRLWSFSVDTNGSEDVIESGEQLCITYLGGDERDIDVNERRQRLLTQWGFWCQCNRCVKESLDRTKEKA